MTEHKTSKSNSKPSHSRVLFSLYLRRHEGQRQRFFYHILLFTHLKANLFTTVT